MSVPSACSHPEQEESGNLATTVDPHGGCHYGLCSCSFHGKHECCNGKHLLLTECTASADCHPSIAEGWLPVVCIPVTEIEPGLSCNHANLHYSTLTCIAWLQHATLSVPVDNGIPDSNADKENSSPDVPFPVSVFDIMVDVAQV